MFYFIFKISLLFYFVSFHIFVKFINNIVFHFLQIWEKLIAISNTRIHVPNVPTFWKLLKHKLSLMFTMFSHKLAPHKCKIFTSVQMRETLEVFPLSPQQQLISFQCLDKDPTLGVGVGTCVLDLIPQKESFKLSSESNYKFKSD